LKPTIKLFQYNGKSIAQNTVYNLIGYGIPLVFALVFYPSLIKNLGAEKFGVLSISWIVLGYFSFFDFGISKGLTKIIAEKLSQKQDDVIPPLFWTSFIIMCSISFFGIALFATFTPVLVNSFNITKNLQGEAKNVFYMLALSLPIVTTSAGFRGVLEAYQKFIIVSAIRSLLGILTIAFPYLCLFFFDDLFLIVAILVCIRLFIWLLYLYRCLKVNPALKKIQFNFTLIKPVFRFSIWITVANIIGPIILYSDRFLIGTVISASSITYYVTPYDIVTKILLIPNALTSVLFPIFSYSYSSNPEIAKRILYKGVKFIFLIVYPIVLILVTFAFELLKLWVGLSIATSSTKVLQYLSIGILLNCLSSIPNNFFQGIGKPKIPILINLMELPFYILFMWLFVKISGIIGASLFYMLAAFIDVVLMFWFAKKQYELNFKSLKYLYVFTLFFLVLFVPFFLPSLELRFFYCMILLLLFVTLGYRFFLTIEEKQTVLKGFTLLNTVK